MHNKPAAGYFERAVSHAVTLLSRAGLSRWRKKAPANANNKDLDIFDLEAVSRHLKKLDPTLLEWSVADAERDVAGASRLVLGLLREPSLRRKFPLALREGEQGSFCRWLTGPGAARLKLSPQAIEHVRLAFQKDPGNRTQHIYLQLPGVHKSQPLAVTPAGGRTFVKWLLKQGRQKYHLADEEILWFIQGNIEDPWSMLVTHYLVQPEWQKEHPLALTATGRREWLAWLERQHQVRVPASAVSTLHLSPVDEVRLIGRQHQQTKPSPSGGQPDFETLVKSVTAEVPPPLQRAWNKRLQRDMEAGLPDKPGVNLIGHFSYPSGLQRAALAMAQALEQTGYRVSKRDLPAGLRNDTLDRSAFLGVELHDITLSVIAPFDSLEKRYQQSGLPLLPDIHRVGVWYWELDQFPAEWIERAASMQELWAPTRFIAEAMRPVMPVPVFEMSPCVTIQKPAQLKRQDFGLAEKDFCFLFMFDMCSVMERKNPIGVIRAFTEAFRGREGVSLAIKVMRGSAFPADYARLQKAAEEAGVALIDQSLAQQDVLGLLNLCDAYVSLHRSEGFGLTLAEAMLLGKPVIATNYSGNLDFMTPENSLLVDYELTAIAGDIQFYGQGNRWAEPSVDDAARKMRWVFEHQAEAKIMAAKGRDEVTELLSVTSAAERMTARLTTIQSAIDQARRS